MLGQLLDYLLDQMLDLLLDPMLGQLLDYILDQLLRLKHIIAKLAQAGCLTKCQARERLATILPFTLLLTSPMPIHKTKVRVNLTLVATLTALAISKGRQVDLIDLIGSSTLIGLFIPPTLIYSPLSSSAFNKGLDKLQALLNKNL